MAGVRKDLPPITESIVRNPRKLAKILTQYFDQLGGEVGTVDYRLDQVGGGVTLEQAQDVAGSASESTVLGLVPDTSRGDGLAPPTPDDTEITVKNGLGINVVDLRKYITDHPIPDLWRFIVDYQYSDDNGGSWSTSTVLMESPSTIIPHGGVVDVAVGLSIPRRYRYRFSVKDVEGNVAGPNPTWVEPIKGTSLEGDIIQTLLLIATKIITPGITGWRLELGDGVYPILYWDGTTTNFSLDTNGNIYLAGRIDFGLGSRLVSDYIELKEQLATPVPVLVQSKIQALAGSTDFFGASSGPSGVSAAWTSATNDGNLLLLAVMVAGTSCPTVTTPAGWTLLASQTSRTDIKTYLYGIQGATSRSGTQAVTFSGQAKNGTVMMLMEYSGVLVSGTLNDANVASVSSSGSSTASTIGTSSPTNTVAQQELWLGIIGAGGPPTFGSPTNSFTKAVEYVGSEGIDHSVFFHLPSFLTVQKTPNTAGALTSASTLSASYPWSGCGVALVASPAAADPPFPQTAGRIRLFGRAVNGVTKLFSKDFGGIESNLLPTGAMILWPSSNIPLGWVVADGASYLRTGIYAPLFSEIGTTWGSVDGTHFNVPDFRGRVPVGVGTGDAADATAHALAQKAGAEGHVLTVGQLASHNHGGNTNANTGATVNVLQNAAGTRAAPTTGAFVFGDVPSHTHPIPNAGSDAAHNNMQPYRAINYIIKL